MTAQLSQLLIAAYAASKKNFNYQLDFLLSSMDLDTCSTCVKLIDEFRLVGDTQSITVDDSNTTRIQKLFGYCDNKLVEKLLWVGLMFPEV